MEKIQLTRHELYDLVWSESLSRLAKKYYISDNGLRKNCKRMNIPLPALGYWQKFQNKKPVVKANLPAFSGKDQLTLYFRDSEGKYIEKVPSPESILKKQIQNDPNLSIRVYEKLTNPDPLVIQAQYTLVTQITSGERLNGEVRTNPGELNISVAPNNTGRALRFMDAFIKMLRSRKHDMIKRNGKPFAVIFGVEVEFRLKGKMKPTDFIDQFTTQVYESTGLLSFIASGLFLRRKWNDGKILIENKLPEILACLELYCTKICQQRLENERRSQLRLEDERRKKELQVRKQAELNAFEDFLNEAIRWQQAQFMRDYLAALVLKGENSMALNPKSEEWISWAKQKINWYDPLINAKDELLDNSDRKKMTEMLNRQGMNSSTNY